MTEENRNPIWPRDLQIIESVETLKVVADPLRLRILAMLRREPATARQIAGELDTPIKKLYYHLGLLEEHALIRVRSTRLVSGILEKQYEPTAYRITVDRGLLSPAAPEPAVPESLDVFLSFVLDHARAEIKKSIAAGLIDPGAPTPAQGGLSLGRLWMRLSGAQRDDLERRMKELHMEYAAQQAAPDTPGAQYYEFLIGVYPTIEPPDAAAERQP
jgi:DNA-binding transcriptional ArsR family regulator